MANHFPLDGKYIRDSTAVSGSSRQKKGVKRKVSSSSQVVVNSATTSLRQVERMLKVPRLAALSERILARVSGNGLVCEVSGTAPTLYSAPMVEYALSVF